MPNRQWYAQPVDSAIVLTVKIDHFHEAGRVSGIPVASQAQSKAIAHICKRTVSTSPRVWRLGTALAYIAPGTRQSNVFLAPVSKFVTLHQELVSPRCPARCSSQA